MASFSGGEGPKMMGPDASRISSLLMSSWASSSSFSSHVIALPIDGARPPPPPLLNYDDWGLSSDHPQLFRSRRAMRMWKESLSSSCPPHGRRCLRSHPT